MDKSSRVQQSYSGVCRATRSAGAYEEQSMPSSSTPSLFSTAVQSVCGIIDHGGHCRQLEDLQAVNRTLEVELERHIKMRDIRIQFANPEYYWDNMKHARQAKRDAEKRAEELQERMSALNKEFSEAILLPIAQEKEIMHLREELDTLKKACEAEKQQRSDANESQAKVIEKLRKVWLLLETERAKLRTHTEKLHDTAHLVDLLSSENCGIRERSKELEQQFELARAAAEDAESRIKKMEEGVAAYCDQVMAYDASMKNNHQMEIDGFNNALMTAADSLKVKESRIEELEADVHARDMQLEDIQLALKDAIETSSIKFDQVVADKEAEIRLLNDRLLTMEQGSTGLDAALRQADKSNAEANVVLEELRRDLGSKNADIQNLRTALASSVSYAKAVHKLQGHIEDLRRNLKDKNLCIDDLKSQIKVLQSPPAVPNPRLAELSEVNARLEKEVSEVKMQRDAALATIEETATKTAKADLVQANLVEKIQMLEASLQARDTRIADLSSQLAVANSRSLTLEEGMNTLERDNVRLTAKEQFLEDEVRCMNRLVHQFSVKVITQVWQKTGLQNALTEAETSQASLFVQVEALQKSGTRLMTESEVLKHQLFETKNDVKILKDSNLVFSEQNQALMVELLAEGGKLAKIEAEAVSEATRFVAQMKHLQDENQQLLAQMSLMEQAHLDSLAYANDLRSSNLETERKLLEMKRGYSSISAEAEDLRTLLNQSLASQPSPARETPAMVSKENLSEVHDAKKNEAKSAPNKAYAKEDFNRRRMFFESAQHGGVIAAASSKIGLTSTLRVRDMVQSLEDNNSGVTFDGRATNKASTSYGTKVASSLGRPSVDHAFHAEPATAKDAEDGEDDENQDSSIHAKQPEAKVELSAQESEVSDDRRICESADQYGGWIEEESDGEAERLGYVTQFDDVLLQPEPGQSSSSSTLNSRLRKTKGRKRVVLKRISKVLKDKLL